MSVTKTPTSWHVHVYFDEFETMEKRVEESSYYIAMTFRSTIARYFPLARIGRVFHSPVGPHPKPMFMAEINHEDLDRMLEFVRAFEGTSILVHPVYPDETPAEALHAHTDAAIWTGEKLDLDLKKL